MTVLALAVLVLVLAGLAVFRIDTAWVARSEVVVSGGWGSAEGEFGRGTGADGRLRGPQALAADAAGNVVVADSLNYRVQVFDAGGDLIAVFPVPDGVSPSASESDRAAAYGLLEPCLAWGSGFRPRPDVVAPARPWLEPVAAERDEEGSVVKAFGRPYITDVDLSVASWTADPATARADPDTGPDVYLLAGWEGAVIVLDHRGEAKWTRSLAGQKAQESGYLLDLDLLHGKGVLVCGYSLLSEELLYFVRVVPDASGEVRDLASYELLRDGTVRIAENLPVALEVESAAVGANGLLYLVGAAPVPGEAPGGAVSPFARDVWIYTAEGRSKGKLSLDCESYTRYVRLIGVDGRGLVFTRLGGAGVPSAFGVFDGSGRAALTIAVPAETEVADAYLGRDGALYVGVASDAGYQVVRYEVRGRSRLVPRWAGKR